MKRHTLKQNRAAYSPLRDAVRESSAAAWLDMPHALLVARRFYHRTGAEQFAVIIRIYTDYTLIRNKEAAGSARWQARFSHSRRQREIWWKTKISTV